MMKTLAVDTSCLTASCAVVEDGRILAEISTQHAKTHSQKLVPMIEALLGIIDMKPESIDLFAAATGPGSFTGLRIGVVTIKGMAYALKRPVCGIPSLDALAYSLQDFSGIICPIMDARNDQIYSSLYRKEGQELNRMTDYMGVHIDILSEELRKYDDDIIMVGDAVNLHYDYFKSRIRTGLYKADPALFTPRASCTALLAEKQASEGTLVSPFDLEPMYLRKSQAERMKYNS